MLARDDKKIKSVFSNFEKGRVDSSFWSLSNAKKVSGMKKLSN